MCLVKISVVLKYIPAEHHFVFARLLVTSWMKHQYSHFYYHFDLWSGSKKENLMHRLEMLRFFFLSSICGTDSLE